MACSWHAISFASAIGFCFSLLSSFTCLTGMTNKANWRNKYHVLGFTQEKWTQCSIWIFIPLLPMRAIRHFVNYKCPRLTLKIKVECSAYLLQYKSLCYPLELVEKITLTSSAMGRCIFLASSTVLCCSGLCPESTAEQHDVFYDSKAQGRRELIP